jgi:hypothetical protein
MPEPMQRILYRLDAADRIEATGGEWERFARANGAPDLDPEVVLNRRLWEFVAGEEVRELLRLVFVRARATGGTVRLPFRCDSPSERRFMELLVHPLPASGLEVESRVLRAEPRAYVPLLERSSRLRYGTISICSWCLKIRLLGGAWVEVEEAVEAMDLFSSADLPNLSHGICRPCAELVFQGIGETRAG